MHLAYIDDSGTNRTSKVVLFGGVVVRESLDYHFVERDAVVAAEQLLPADRLVEFTEFKTRDLFRGKKAFEGISEGKRFAAIEVLLMALEQQNIQFIYSAVNRAALEGSPLSTADPRMLAFDLCLLGIEDWARAQPDRFGRVGAKDDDIVVEPKNFVLVIVDEDRINESPTDEPAKRELRGPTMRDLQSASFRKLRARWLAATAPLSNPAFKQNRLWHFHDAMYFGDSRDSVGLQIADLCAYFMAAHLAGALDEKGEAFYQLVKRRSVCAKPEPEWNQYRHLLVEHEP